MENRYSYYRQGKSIKIEEFQEEDVWGVFKETKDKDSRAIRPVTIPKPNKNLYSQEPVIIQHSAPVTIPDWSKIYGTASEHSSKKARSWLNKSNIGPNNWESNDDEDDDDDEGNVIPPHELIARKVARNQISSFSVCEGAGRTLKGRDLSRVRNAVLTKTGFLE